MTDRQTQTQTHRGTDTQRHRQTDTHTHRLLGLVYVNLFKVIKKCTIRWSSHLNIFKVNVIFKMAYTVVVSLMR